MAFSLVGMGLGDRIILEAPLRLHRKNYPDDYLIAIVDRHGTPDLPCTLRRRFHELWWIAAGDGRQWSGSPRTAVARRLRDALVAARVRELFVPFWKAQQIPANGAFITRPYNLFGDARHLRDLGVYPRLTVPAAARRWAREALDACAANRYDAFISLHVRNVGFSPDRNLDLDMLDQLLCALRRMGRFGFVLLGRDDETSRLTGRDIHSFVGRQWTFEQTAAVIAHTRLFIGGESGLTHAAAALGVPVVGVGFVGRHAYPFARQDRAVCFQRGEAPQTIVAEVKRFAQRRELASARRKEHGR